MKREFVFYNLNTKSNQGFKLKNILIAFVICKTQTNSFDRLPSALKASLFIMQNAICTVQLIHAIHVLLQIRR